jgi:hypothetical protein
MMSRTNKKLTPIGCNMNDAAYPFRGQHKLEDCINHGHSGVSKKFPTSIGMRITGSNLVIEQVQTPKGVELECELGVDGGIPRPVSLHQASALMVPGDGHDYNLTATVHANGAPSKHYCKLTFNGSEGTNVLRVRAPEGCHPDSVYIVADGRRLRPTAGWFRIPIQTKECSLVANFSSMPEVVGREATGDGNAGVVTFLANSSFPSFSPQNGGQRRGGTKSPLSPQPSQLRRSPTRQRDTVVGNGEPTILADAHFFLETVPAPPPTPGTTATPLLVCTSTGHVIPLAPHGTVAVPHAGAPFRLVLPAQSGSAVTPTRAAVPPHPAGGPTVVPDVETRIEAPAVPGTQMPSFVVTAPNFVVQLIGEDGRSASGQGVAALPFAHRRAQAVQIVVKDAQGNVVVRQKSHVPPLQSAPAVLQMKDDGSGNLVVTTNPSNSLTVSGVPQANPAAGAVLPRVVPQQVVVEQPNADGTLSSLSLEVASKGSGPAMPPSSTAVPVPIPLAGGMTPPAGPTAASPAPSTAAAMPAPAPERWVMELFTALQKTGLDEQRRLTQAIQPSTLPGMTIVNFVRDQLTRQPPVISFTVSRNGLEAVQCPGCTLSATVGSDPARPIPNHSAVQLTPGKPLVLTATSTSTQRPVSACCVQMSTVAGDGASALSFSPHAPGAGYNPYGIATPSAASGVASADNRADTELVTRVLDSLIRRNVDAAAVADELGEMSTAPFSSQGRRMMPLLTACLRSASASGAAAAAAKAASDQEAAAAAAPHTRVHEEIFFTCGPGYVDNVYTTSPQMHLFGAVDDQAPQVLQQRGRVPAQGVLVGERKPFFVRLTARDPATGAVVIEKTFTVLGVAPPSTAAPSTNDAAVVTTAPPTAGSTTMGAVTPLALLSSEGATGAAAPQAPPEGVGAERSFNKGAPPTAVEAASAAATSAPPPYIDVSLQTVGQDVQARFLCPPQLRIVCDVDGVGGHTGLSDFVTKMLASRFHRVNLSLVDTYGKVVFQQKLDVPAMSSSVWGLAVQHNGLSVDPESGSLAAASVDRSPERALQGNFLSFDASMPHYVYLRKYLNGIHGSCIGEVALRLPGLTLPPELAEVTSILRRRASRQLSDAQAKTELQQLRPRCTSPAVSELISCILDSWCGGSGPMYGVGPDTPTKRVFFRLTGTD